MDLEQLKDELFSKLKEVIRVTRMTAGNKEITTRCVYCGDSRKNSYHTHMYIGSPNNTVLLYFCQRCNVEGIVNSDFLRDYNINDLNLNSSLINYNRGIFKNNKRRTEKGLFKFKESNYKFSKGVLFKDYKKGVFEYFESRTGLELTKETLEKYKVIVSLYDFLNEEQETYNSLYKKAISIKREDYFLHKIKLLEENYIGFMTSDSSRIIFRLVTEADLKRYELFQLFETENQSFFSTRNEIDLSKPITINMAEGVFDIINIENKFNKRDNCINVAVLNKSYFPKLTFILKNFLATMSLLSKVNIFSDPEVKIGHYKKQFSKNNYLFSRVDIFKNSRNEDFGDIEKIGSLIKIK